MSKQKLTAGSTQKERVKSSGAASMVWFFIGAIILAGSFLLNQRFIRPAAVQQLGGQTNGFHGRSIKDEYASPQRGEYQTVSLPYKFSVNVNELTAKMRITFRYRCSPTCKALWFAVDSKNNVIPMRLLLKHELLDVYRLPSVSNKAVTLYQKTITYPSVEAFLKNPPVQGMVLTEPTLLRYWPQLRQSNLEVVESVSSSMPKPDYFLTTYIRPRIFGDGWYEFDRIIDLSNIVRNPDNTVVVRLEGDQGTYLDVTSPTVTLDR